MSNDKVIKVVKMAYKNKNEIKQVFTYAKYVYDMSVLFSYGSVFMKLIYKLL